MKVFYMCFYNVDGVFIETHPDGNFIIRISVQDDNEGIEVRDNCVMHSLLKGFDVSYYSRILVRGFHKTIIRY